MGRRHLRHPEAAIADVVRRVDDKRALGGQPLTPVYEIRMLRREPIDGRWTDMRGKVKGFPPAEALKYARDRVQALLDFDFEDVYRGGQIKLLGWV